MADAAQPGQLDSVEELGRVWTSFREGNVVKCVKCNGPLALAVDAGAGVYRFVCTWCGNASPWFESGPAGMRIRSLAPGLGPSTLSDD